MSKDLTFPEGPKLFFGVVEDIFDPLKAGRARVRIFGYHDQDKSVLPTADLPWALPIMPITSASISGKGTSPVGVLTGSWVIGLYIDGDDMQQPAFFGTFSGISPAVGSQGSMSFQQPPEREIVTNRNNGVLKDSSGTPVKDSSGNNIVVATPAQEGWTLGQTSEKYESGGRGAGTINDYTNSGDYGGASYGAYQYASYMPANRPNGKARPNWQRSPVMVYLGQSKFGTKFAGLTPGTAAFDAMWKSVAASDGVVFKSDQHDYIKTNYYDVLLSKLRSNSLDLTKFGPAVQDAIWSTSVQYGPGATSVFLKPLENKSQLTDKDIVNLVQDYKKSSVGIYFKSSSPAIQNSIKTRCDSEKVALLNLIK